MGAEAAAPVLTGRFAPGDAARYGGGVPVAESSDQSLDQLRSLVRDIPDFPSPGILFKDITPLLADGDAWRVAVDHLAGLHDIEPVDRVVGIESRGFILAAAVADRLGAGFVPIRKPGKLPSTTLGESYALEYGTDSLEIHDDALGPHHRVLVVDDVLATGGTARAAANLVQRLGSTLHGLAFLIELEFLKGRDRLDGRRVTSVIQY